MSLRRPFTPCGRVLCDVTQDEDLWEKYYLERRDLAKRTGLALGNEKWLLHGTSSTDPNIICRTGFDFRYGALCAELHRLEPTGMHTVVVRCLCDRTNRPGSLRKASLAGVLTLPRIRHTLVR